VASVVWDYGYAGRDAGRGVYTAVVDRCVYWGAVVSTEFAGLLQAVLFGFVDVFECCGIGERFRVGAG
jgi:hypothetical protein